MPRSDLAATNASEITVSELSGALKRTIEDRFGYVRVRGEISGYRGPHVSGHVYFTLKDETARLDAVIWKATFLRMGVKPAEGMEVVASGKITTFAGKSSYQIVIDSVEPAGVGALMALLETRRRQLATEGLFDNARKRELPYLPRTIGVVTSPGGAVIRDILHRLADRCPVRVLVWAVRVQGESAADEIAAAILGFNTLPSNSGVSRPDVLIVARGGGSLEDLWSFNEEVVVRAAAASAIPLVSAVGHETDWTLIDHVADLRAPTPTAAAELCVPVRSELIVRIAAQAARASSALIRVAQQSRTHLRSAKRGLVSGETLLAGANQRKDRAADRLKSTFHSAIDQRLSHLANLARNLARYSPHVQWARGSERARAITLRLLRIRNASALVARQRFERIQIDLERALRQNFDEHKQQLALINGRWALRHVEMNRFASECRLVSARAGADLHRACLGALAGYASVLANAGQLFAVVNHMAVLRRGYALVHSKSGAALSRASDARAAGDLKIAFADGEIAARVQGRYNAKRRKKNMDPTEQRTLF